MIQRKPQQIRGIPSKLMHRPLKRGVLRNSVEQVAQRGTLVEKLREEPVEPVIEVFPEPVEVEELLPEVKLLSMLNTKAELVAAAEALGFTVTPDMTKRQILAAIQDL